MNRKKIILLVFIIIFIIGIGSGFAIYKFVQNKSNNISGESESIANTNIEETTTVPEVIEKVDIIDINSTSRPFAVTVNNTPVAVKVQEGLNKAYLVYELPTEGGTSRLLAFFKDIDDVTIGTIRSARHNFVDYALESNAIFTCFGWSHYAENDLKKGSINYIQGLFDSPFWRNNPEKLASEHTAYTSISKLRETAIAKKFNLDAASADSTVLLKYNVSDVDLSKNQGSTIANLITISYGSGFKTEFKYDAETGLYNRFENGSANTDYETKEQFNTKNIIVQKITYNMCDDGYYWDLHTIGSGKRIFHHKWI